MMPRRKAFHTAGLVLKGYPGWMIRRLEGDVVVLQRHERLRRVDLARGEATSETVDHDWLWLNRHQCDEAEHAWQEAA